MKQFLSPVARELYQMSLDPKNEYRLNTFEKMIRKYEKAYKAELRKKILKPVK